MSRDLLMHLANVVFLFSFAARDVMWLRVLSFSGGLLLCTYFATFEPPALAPLAWQLLFLAIHAYRIATLAAERRPVALTDAEERLHGLVFRPLSRRELAKLARVGRWVRVDPGDALCSQGEALDRLMVIGSGLAEVWVDGAKVAELRPGRFVGEMGFLLDQPTSASVVAVEPTEYLAWEKPALRGLVAACPEIGGVLQQTLGSDLASKLRGEKRHPGAAPPQRDAG